MDSTEQPSTAERISTHTDPYAALRFRDFRLLAFGSLFAVIAEQMLGVAIGWELYARTSSPLALGLIGLVQIVPVVLLALPAGQIADRHDRKRVVFLAMLLLALCAAGLALLSWTRGPLVLIYVCLLGIGIGRAFQSPAFAALMSQVVPAEHYGNAATWGSSAWQMSAIIGPALGGFLIAAFGGATLVYVLVSLILVFVAIALALIHARPVPRAEEEITIGSMLAGLRFVWNTKIILAAISLDMFAVLLGGATALLPIFATDILMVGPVGLGYLRAAPAVGAVTMALLIAHRPPFKHAGRVLLWVVAGFGLATVVFGLSRSFPLSLAMLVLLGALDNVSVVIRSTLLLTRTPDIMRGRVNAVHYVFIGISNELGAFESGVAAALLSTVGAVVAGGIGTVLVVALIALYFPEIRQLGRLQPEPVAAD